MFERTGYITRYLQGESYMNYEKLVQGILNIGESMLECGAEIFRVEDSLYRMYKSYGFLKYDVFVIPSNIQVTVESPQGKIITQIRHIETTGFGYDKLNYLNALSRYVCSHHPNDHELQRRYEKIMKRPEQSEFITGIAEIVGGTGFTVFFGGDLQDMAVAFFVSLMLVLTGKWLSRREGNLMIYNLILAFLSELMIVVVFRAGIGHHPDCIMIGIIMLLVSALGAINGMRDVMQRNFISGSLEVMNSFLGAFGIAAGIALAMLTLGNVPAEGFDVNQNVAVQLISCTVGCTGLASWFKIRGRKVLYSGIGAFFTWGIYLLIYEWYPSNFFAMVVASCFVAGFAFIMSRVSHAPSTLFLTAAVFPLMPGARLYYLMYGLVSRNFEVAVEHALVLLETCLGIAFGFIIIDVISRSIMRVLGREYHMGKESTVIKNEN